MATHVGRARVRVRARGLGPARTRALRAELSRELLSRLLEECERLLARRLRTTELRVYVRSLRARFAATAGEVQSPAWLQRIAAELADSVVDLAGDGASWLAHALHPASQAVAFRTVAHERAARMAVERSGAEPFWLEAAEAAAPFTAALAEGPASVVALVRVVAEVDPQLSLLLRLEPAELACAARVVPFDRWPIQAAAREELRARTAGENGLRAPMPGAERIPAPAPPAGDGALAPAEAGEPAQPALPGSRAVERVSPVPAQRGTAVPPSGARDRAQDLRRGGAATEADEPPLGTTMTPCAPSGGAPPPHVAMPSSSAPEQSEEPRSEVASTIMSTRFGGLFFLVPLVYELDLAEALWCAGLQEGRVLHAAALVLCGVGHAEDPAPAVFGGELPRAPLVTERAARWACDEVRRKVRGAVPRALQRRRLDMADPQIDAVLRARRDELVPRVAGLALAEDYADLVLDSAAGLAALFQIRLNRPDIAETVERYLRIEGQIALRDDRVEVALPMDAIDLDVRRAGLDQNMAGVAAWLGRRVEIEFRTGPHGGLHSRGAAQRPVIRSRFSR